MKTIIINSTVRDAINLAIIFGKPIIEKGGNIAALDVPEWIELMYVNAIDADFVGVNGGQI